MTDHLRRLSELVEPLPCPFCGCEVWKCGEYAEHPESDCTLSTGLTKMAAWNTRAPAAGAGLVEGAGLPSKLRAYRPTNEWGDSVHHVICDEAADALEALLARITALEAEREGLREALVVLRDLPIVENDNPNTLHLGEDAYTGPAVDWTFKIIRKVKQVAQSALQSGSEVGGE